MKKKKNTESYTKVSKRIYYFIEEQLASKLVRRKAKNEFFKGIE